jgi:nickel transport protein
MEGLKMNKILISAIAFCFLMFTNVFAHDFWLEKKDGKIFIVSGHDDKWDAYDPARVKEVKAFDSKGNILKIDVVRQKEAAYIVPKENLAMISVFFDNHFWTKTTDGWKNITKREAVKQSLQILESGQSFKYAKYIEKWSDNFTMPVGSKMEIIPLKNPLSLKAGDVLPITVLLDGKPLEGASIYLQGSHDVTAQTAKDGAAAVKIKSGHNIVSSTTRVPFTNNPDADQLYLRASISFESKR